MSSPSCLVAVCCIATYLVNCGLGSSFGDRAHACSPSCPKLVFPNEAKCLPLADGMVYVSAGNGVVTLVADSSERLVSGGKSQNDCDCLEHRTIPNIQAALIADTNAGCIITPMNTHLRHAVRNRKTVWSLTWLDSRAGRHSRLSVHQRQWQKCGVAWVS
ncbi:hypothetical protein BT67DRAFT_42361 [Trichocladium antarcticum]|uniref:Uncharacterized protein n=1 Tax=Trichocladium antarcticum TaxID=1450529 RepID=A0AAN6UIR1_9PEZI|nr:hypothetical protein BT67DRAFT_42361 [Trichocladium antarcticum]